ncbi:dixin-like isoform X3 [Oryzias latipes]|uniref:dixin-like isoform X3 n=1 Tax=Oryzias latipes TaxID=8090 RepID=UPI000CE17901|nr:dixin-like isoform X3 [Oryzias latipes]
MIASLSRGSALDEVLHGSSSEQQLVAYVSWVNAQLRKRPGLKPIKDLRRDLQDGEVLVHLIEIVAGVVLDGVFVPPQSREESRKNVEEVLHFISSRHIHMPHISAKDVLEGNLKSLMRIVLALAAHFKPSANQRTASGSGRSLTQAGSGHNPHSAVALAQGAAAALVSARLDASLPVRTTRIHGGLGSAKDPSVCVRALVEQYERGASDEQDPLQSSSLSSPSPLTSLKPCSTSSSQQPECSGAESSLSVPESEWEKSLSESLEKEVQEARSMVSSLQALLLRGALPEEEHNVALDPGNPQQQLVVVRSHLDQSMEEVRELKRELLRCKQEVRNLQAVKDAQQQRLCTQEASILQMKQELLRASMLKEELGNQNAGLQWKLEESNRLWSECKKDIGQKDKLLQQLKQKLEESRKLQTELQKQLEHKGGVLQELMSGNLQQIPINPENNGYSHCGSSAHVSGAEEVQLMQDALRSLRNKFLDHDPQQHTLDTLEQGIVSLMDRLHALHTHRMFLALSFLMNLCRKEGNLHDAKISTHTWTHGLPRKLSSPTTARRPPQKSFILLGSP